jgi:hypothetical protein
MTARLGIFLALWTLLLLGGRSRLFRDPGTFWHTRVGELLLLSDWRRGDPFSYTFADHDWIPHQWLGEILLFRLERAGGLDAQLAAAAALLAALYGWVAHRLMRSGLHWSLAACLVVLALGAGSANFHVRPHLATMVGFAVTLAALLDCDAQRFPAARLFWLVPLYALWANIHGGMIGGLATMVLALLGWTVVRLASPAPSDPDAPQPLAWRDLALLGGVVAACGLTSLVNPYGVELPRAWLAILGSPLLPTIIQEHAPIDPARPDGMVVIALFAIYVAVLAGVPVRRWRVSWLLAAAWFLLACRSLRHGPLFGLAATLTIAEAFPLSRWADLVVRRGSDLFTPPSPDDARRFPSPGFTALVAFPMLFGLGWLAASLTPGGLACLDPDHWPVGIESDLRAIPNGERLFNDLNFGGFVIGFVPQRKVFIDDRCELYGDEFLRDYAHAERQAPERLDAWQREYDFRWALTRTGGPFDRHLRRQGSGWSVVRERGPATLFVRDEEAVP